jgi:hypothetical protein
MRLDNHQQPSTREARSSHGLSFRRALDTQPRSAKPVFVDRALPRAGVIPSLVGLGRSPNRGSATKAQSKGCARPSRPPRLRAEADARGRRTESFESWGLLPR